MKKLMAVLICLTMLCGMTLPALAQDAVKDETVYVLCTPDGEARRIIVSDWLSNPQGADTLEDISTLTHIENVKGTQPYQDGAWQAKGADIYYQGDSEAPLPVDMQVTYTLDGEAIAPEELAGRDGHVTVRFDYTVSAQQSVLVDDAWQTVNVPFAVVTGALLENAVFSNVQAQNACVINDGDHTIVAGIALPGLQESLQMACDAFELPAYVQFEADVKGFALPLCLSAASSEVFAALDAQKLENTEDLKAAANELTAGIEALLAGSGQLYDGLGELSAGADALLLGAQQLSGGLNELTANNDALKTGSEQVFAALLSMANEQLAAAHADVPALTMDNYAQTLSTLLEAMSEQGITQQARTQVEEAVQAQRSQVRAAVEQAVQAQVSEQVTLSVQQSVQEQVLAAMNIQAEAYSAALENGQVSAQQQQQLDAAVAQQMAADTVQAMIAQQTQQQLASDAVQALIEDNTNEQLAALVAQQMASDAVQAQISQSVSQYAPMYETLAALKAQLDSYQAFHTGLTDYLAGAETAAAGAQQLSDSVPELQAGIAALQAGALEIKNGLAQFKAEGTDQLAQLANETLPELLGRVRAVIAAADAYQNYSGIAEDMTGTVRFIWRMDAISSDK